MGNDRKLPLNLFDIIIILIVIAAAGIFIFMQTRGEDSQSTAAKNSTIEYTVEIANISDKTEGMIKPGDSIVDKVKKYNIGTVKSVEYYPATKEAFDYEKGAAKYSELPGRLSAAVTITAECTESDSAAVVGGGFEVRTGTETSIVGPGYSGAGYIISVVRGDK